jgi:hypothetical protein
MPILQPPLTTGSITANAQRITADVTGYSAAQISVHGTYAGVNLTFEGSDDAGVTWYPVQAVRAADATLEATSGALTNTARLWYVAAGALTTVSVRSTAYASGAATIGITPVHDVDSLLGAAAAAGALAAGENHLGSVGGNTASLIKPLTVSTSAYSAGNCVGGLITLTGALRTGGPLTGLLQSVFVADKSNQKAALDLLFFTSIPAGTFTDHAAFPTLTQADALLVRRRVSIAASDYVTVGGSAFADISAIGKVISGAATTLYLAIATTGTPTYANAADLQVTVGILQD